MVDGPTLLRALSRSRHWQSYDTFKARFERVARALADAEGNPTLAVLSVSKRQFERWMAGTLRTQPHPAQCRVLEAMFERPVAELLSPAADIASTVVVSAAEPIGRSVSHAAVESAMFGRWADSLAMGDLALTALRLRVEQLATAYVHAPMIPVFHELLAVRDELFELLKSPDPGQARELYFLAGITCGLLAHASGNLGDVRAAHIQACTAIVCARHARHATLVAWVLGVRALQCVWSGHAEEGLRCVAQAQLHTAREDPPSSVAAWVHAIEARAHARAGRSADVSAAIERSLASRQRLASAEQPNDIDEIGGILTFPEAKQHFYIASAYRRVGQLAVARDHAQSAIHAYGNGAPEERSYGDESLARIDLAIAYTDGGHPDLAGAIEVLKPVVTLPTDMRLAILVGPLREFKTTLAKPSVAGAREAQELQASIAEILATCQPPLVAIGA
jgi:hypothetical protein